MSRKPGQTEAIKADAANNPQNPDQEFRLTRTPIMNIQIKSVGLALLEAPAHQNNSTVFHTTAAAHSMASHASTNHKSKGQNERKTSVERNDVRHGNDNLPAGNDMM
jgi:hypothetical protein